MELSPPPIFESKEGYGMQGWFQSIYRYVRRASALTNVTAAYTIPDNVFYVRANATSGAYAVTLPASTSCEGRRVLVCKVDSSGNAVTVTCAGSDTIQGSATVSLAAQWNKAYLISNGANGWERIV